MKYRDDIDGLRAIAVLSVIFYHAGFISGGFIGVDIFFVISGYLITKIILKDKNSSAGFSLLNFYERRIRRIFPALFLVLTFCIIAGYFLLFPYEYYEISKALLSASTFTSNIYFLFTENYFNKDSHLKPLIHTWSLSVEEQFYIFYPILILLFFRRLKLALISFAILSFLYCIYSLEQWEENTFYSPLSRAWEFLFGAILASKILPLLKNRAANEFLGGFGLSLILYSAYSFSDYIAFPDYRALLPCIGAFLIIYSAENKPCFLSNVISIKPLKFIGLISYSLYLWHWPLLVFFNNYENNLLENSTANKIILIIISIILASISTKYIENPYRKKQNFSGRFIYIHATVLIAIFTSISLIIISNKGFEKRYSDDVNKLVEITYSYNEKRIEKEKTQTVCSLNSRYPNIKYFDKDACLKLDKNEKNYLLIGDSYAGHLLDGLKENFLNTNFLFGSCGGTRPIIIPEVIINIPKRCIDFYRYIFEEFLPQNKIDGLILSGRWTDGEDEQIIEIYKYAKGYVDNIYVFGPIVEYKKNLPSLILKAILEDDKGLINKNRKSQQEVIDKKFSKKISEYKNLHYISVYKTLCEKDGKCITKALDGLPIQWDYGHLTTKGSKLLIKLIKDKGLFNPE